MEGTSTHNLLLPRSHPPSFPPHFFSMEETTTHNLLLPPSKRFKLLHPPAAAACLPAKKRTLPITTTTCLPAKKRVWAPHPLSPLKHHQEISQPIKETAAKDKKKVDDEVDDEDDGVICAVCGSTDGDPSDPIVFCDGCDLMVHASCYGNPLVQSIPQGDWFCFGCRHSDNDEEQAEHRCCLCPKPGGAVKPTTDGGWAHILCALLVPEVFFRDPEGRDGIDCSEVPADRRKVKCYICGCKSGCGIECSEPRCELGFHVSCGIEEGLCIEYKEGRGAAIVAGFCGDHTQLWKKQQLTGKFKIVARGGGSLGGDERQVD